jgi:SAM-dependent methyltransferase
VSVAELQSRLKNGLRDHRLYGDEFQPRGRRARLKEIARNVAIGVGATRLRGETVQFEYRGYKIPADLAEMTGGGADTWEAIALAHLGYYERWTPMSPTDAVLEIGCGIGRDALHLIDVIEPPGRYVGMDITGPSIRWCKENITRDHTNFRFVHLDVRSPMYNPNGAFSTDDVEFPLSNLSFDLVFLHSVFTHMFGDAIEHYLAEIARVLKSTGQVMASFFIVDDDTLAAADANGSAQTFRHTSEGADRINDANHPEAAVGFTLERIEAMAAGAGLKVTQDHRGFWSGRNEDAPNGQDIVILEPL